MNQNIWQEILDERKAQDAKHGGIKNDDKNTVHDWWLWIRKHSDLIVALNLKHTQRYQLIRVAALAVAAIEAYDRNNGFPN